MGKTNWIPVHSPNTGSLERRSEDNYCHCKRQASTIQLLLVTFLHWSITPHIQSTTPRQPTRSHLCPAELTLPSGVDCCNRGLLVCLHRCRQKKEANKEGIQGVKDTNPKEIKLYFPQDALFNWGLHCACQGCSLGWCCGCQQDAPVQGRNMNVTNVPDI